MATESREGPENAEEGKVYKLMSAGMLYVHGHLGQTLTDYAERIYGGEAS